MTVQSPQPKKSLLTLDSPIAENQVEGRTSAEVFSTWKTFRANGFTLDTRNRTNATFICRACGAELPKGDRLYTNSNQSAAIHFYAESCQRYAAPGQTVHHEPIQSIAKIKYIRNQPPTGKRIPYSDQPKTQWAEVQQNGWSYLPNLADPLYGENSGVWQRTNTKPLTPKRPRPIAGLLPSGLPAAAHGEGSGKGFTFLQGASTGNNGLLLLPAPKPIAPGTLQVLWQCTHLICAGRPEFNDYCKTAGYLKQITGRELHLPEQLSDSEGQLVIAQIRADSLKIAPSIMRSALDVIGRIAMGSNSWACTTGEVLKRTSGRTTLFTRLYISELAEWRKQLEASLTAEQHAEVTSRLAALRHEALTSAIA